jgi:CheY-like chemotaxis protein
MVPVGIKSLSPAAQKSTRTILVVEDEAPIRLCVTEFLRDCGYVVAEAGDVAGARDVLIRRPVDLVFSDINMPNGETGFALEKWVRRHYPNVKVLLTSGYLQATADTADLLEPIVPKPYSYLGLWQRFERLFCLPVSTHQISCQAAQAVG